MNMKWSVLLIGLSAVAVPAVSRAETPNLVISDIGGTLALDQSLPFPCGDLTGSIPVQSGRIEIAPATGVATGGGQFFVLTQGVVLAQPFTTHVSCDTRDETRSYSELGIQIAVAVPFVASPAGTGAFSFSIPAADVVLYEGAIVNGASEEGYQNPRDPVTGTIDLVRGTLELHVVGTTHIDAGVLGGFDGTLTATLSGTFTPPNLPPVASCQDISASAGGSCTASVDPSLVDAGSSDPDGDAVSLSLAPPGPFALGSTPVTLTATDPAGAASSCPANVVVVDATAPAITCPANALRGNDPGLCGAAVPVGSAIATDNCPGVGVGGTRSDGQGLSAAYPVGTTGVAWTARDGAGNSSACTQTVTVDDTEPPVFGSLAATPARLWPPDHRLRRVSVSLTTRDNCAPAPTVKLVSITCSDRCEPSDIQGAAIGTDSRSFLLRAELAEEEHGERHGRAHGHDDERHHSRTYTITYSATDAAGNTTLATTSVLVAPPPAGDHDRDRDTEPR
jgi:hypothetical protein